MPNLIPPGGCLRFNNKAFFPTSKRQDKTKPHGKNNSVLITRAVNSEETNGVTQVRVEEKSKCGVEAQPAISWQMQEFSVQRKREIKRLG